MHAQRAPLTEGRWHFQHGPIDIVLAAKGDTSALNAAHAQAWHRFQGILEELTSELPLLREPVQGRCLARGPVAQRMWRACEPYQNSVITPMAAVAGSVAQELLQYYQVGGIQQAWVNNGGDIALHMASTDSVRVGLFANLATLNAAQIFKGVDVDGVFEIRGDSNVRGVATSGWRGRSFSLGIADSVTVLAGTAAQADAAATVIANAVNVKDGRIARQPACSIKDDSDLGDRLVTVDVPALPPYLVSQALAAGLACALSLRTLGLIHSAVLVCQNQCMTTERALAPLARQTSAKAARVAEFV